MSSSTPPGPPYPGPPAQQGYPGQPGQQGHSGQPGQQANPYATAGGSDPGRPGSRAWVDQRYGTTTDVGDRVVPYLVDWGLQMIALVIPFVIGAVLLVAGIPDQEPCVYTYGDCSVPGTGSTPLVVLGVLFMFLSSVVALAVWAWNRVWRVSRTGQSLGRKVGGLHVLDAETGALPRVGQMVIRELVLSVTGIIAIVWMFFDDDKRTLSDMAGKTAVVKDRRTT